MAHTAPHYSAIIRTDRCDDLVRRMATCLRAQSLPPSEIIFVDSSGSTSCSDDLGKLGARVIRYPTEPFNFSKAINVGIDAAQFENCLIISSHVLLHDVDLLANGVHAAQKQNCSVVYWAPVPDGATAGSRKVSAAVFNGTNGLSNSCGFAPTALLRKRPFREDVFSAEDQEWAAWYLRECHGNSLGILAPGLQYLNPNMNATKIINQEIAIAYYVYRRNLLPDYIGKRYLRALLAAVRRRPDRARLHWEIAKGLTLAIFRKPVRQSKYF